MTEKRFFQDGNEILTWIRDKETWEKLKTDTDVINKLNELAEENEQSKMMIATLRNTVLDQEDLEKENKKLKEKLDDILELTELTGMIHLRKAEIKSIINR